MSSNKNSKIAKSQVEEEGSSGQDGEVTAQPRLLLTLLIFFLVASGLYMRNVNAADSHMADVVIHKPQTPTLVPTNDTSPVAVVPSDASNPAEDVNVTVGEVASDAPGTTETPISEEQDSPSSSSSGGGGGGDFDASCSDVCTKREANRKKKFGGDLLDFQELVRLAEAEHKKVESALREDYGEYFDPMFVKNGTNPDGGTHYHGMKPPNEGGASRERMKRKMKLKILKMMSSIKATESNVHGCDCIGKSGSVDSGVDEDVLTTIPEFYEKYVFANGGHSNAAGHGNMFNESYTAVFGRDVRPIMEAIGIELIDRNYAMGAMRSFPFMSSCTKEVYGKDVDLLAWNFGMTDGKMPSAAHYVYRGAVMPNHPAIVMVDATIAPGLNPLFEKVGLAMFESKADTPQFDGAPDLTPDGIPIPDKEANKLPPMVKYLKCGRRFEGKDLCFGKKWSCTDRMKNSGVDCICPHIGKRSSWHMGYRMHALHGHLLSLPFIEMLLEALKELVDTETSDFEELLADIQKEEDAEFQQFMESPLLTQMFGDQYDPLGNSTDPLFETWFRGNSICRTTFLPAQSRFLGLMTESNKTGDVAMYTHETYETGFYYTARDGNFGGRFVFKGSERPPEGKFSLVARQPERAGWKDVAAWEAECPAVVMPDYKDWLYAPLVDGKASITFPNEKEKAYYGYDPKNFKGIIAVIMAIPEGCKKCPHPYDHTFADFVLGNAFMTVNSKPVKRAFLLSNAMILEGDGGNIFWEPDPETEDYTIEFIAGPNTTEYHLMLSTLVLM
ncbi:unnamed protein product [Cylindrotheca closterium]|uniref:Uncharacterized protein n=1 Tax=Cylindrotheca closterium TaxID=2856 RepID=A0AAD2G422_9STRA|nr:unnamed protein product [Cylindrotheca closterium]